MLPMLCHTAFYFPPPANKDRAVNSIEIKDFIILLVCQTYVTPYLMKSWSVSFGDFHPSGRIGKQL